MLFPTLAGATEIDLKPDSKQNEITGNAVWLIWMGWVFLIQP